MVGSMRGGGPGLSAFMPADGGGDDAIRSFVSCFQASHEDNAYIVVLGRKHVLPSPRFRRSCCNSSILSSAAWLQNLCRSPWRQHLRRSSPITKRKSSIRSGTKRWLVVNDWVRIEVSTNVLFGVEISIVCCCAPVSVERRRWKCYVR